MFLSSANHDEHCAARLYFYLASQRVIAEKVNDA